uniref:Uncharacterized protein n=1 Tax=Lactuca sativa TaxID=4236 RepID=A0A9R1WZR8_LACSA|nr:hypothetical protein LSAT_V11C800399490 [Lactuca sativa]
MCLALYDPIAAKVKFFKTFPASCIYVVQVVSYVDSLVWVVAHHDCRNIARLLQICKGILARKSMTPNLLLSFVGTSLHDACFLTICFCQVSILVYCIASIF